MESSASLGFLALASGSASTGCLLALVSDIIARAAWGFSACVGVLGAQTMRFSTGVRERQVEELLYSVWQFSADRQRRYSLLNPKALRKLAVVEILAIQNTSPCR